MCTPRRKPRASTFPASSGATASRGSASWREREVRRGSPSATFRLASAHAARAARLPAFPVSGRSSCEEPDRPGVAALRTRMRSRRAAVRPPVHRDSPCKPSALRPYGTKPRWSAPLRWAQGRGGRGRLAELLLPNRVAKRQASTGASDTGTPRCRSDCAARGHQAGLPSPGAFVVLGSGRG